MQSTYFSTKERTGRGDTSAWTDNPQQKAKKEAQQCVFGTHFLTLMFSKVVDLCCSWKCLTLLLLKVLECDSGLLWARC